MLNAVSRCTALLATGLALGPALAHLFELPNKIALPRDQYLVVQTIYNGWNRLGFVLALQLAAIVAVIVLSRDDPRARWAGIIALLALVCAQAVFWAFTFPANQATANWTTMPDNWDALRHQWEYSHAVGAGFQFTVLAALAIGLVARRPAEIPPR